MYVSSSVIGIMGSGILCRFMVLCIYWCNGFCCSIHSFYLFIVVNPTVVGVSTTSHLSMSDVSTPGLGTNQNRLGQVDPCRVFIIIYLVLVLLQLLSAFLMVLSFHHWDASKIFFFSIWNRSYCDISNVQNLFIQP